MEICCLIVTLSQSLISMSIDNSHPNELLWWLPGYNFPTPSFLLHTLICLCSTFLKRRFPLSLMYNKIKYFICVYVKPQVLISPNGLWLSFIVMFESLQIRPVGVRLAAILSRIFEVSLYFLEHFHSFWLNLLFSPMSSYTWFCVSFSYVPCVGMNWVGLGRQCWVFLVCE